MRRVVVLAAIIGLAIAPTLFAVPYPCPRPGSTAPVVILQNAKTNTGNGTELQLDNCTNFLTIYVVWAASSAAGQVVIETAESTGYTGTWAPLATVNFSVASKADVVNIIAPMRFVRARIASAITSGSVTIKAQGASF